MKCLHCSQLLPDAVSVEWNQGAKSRNVQFRCPHCDAEHVRQQVGTLPSGEALYSHRLWGHLSLIRKRSELASAK
jgi:hypothetical protein